MRRTSIEISALKRDIDVAKKKKVIRPQISNYEIHTETVDREAVSNRKTDDLQDASLPVEILAEVPAEEADAVLDEQKGHASETFKIFVQGNPKPHNGDQDLGHSAGFSAKTLSVVDDTGKCFLGGFCFSVDEHSTCAFVSCQIEVTQAQGTEIANNSGGGNPENLTKDECQKEVFPDAAQSEILNETSTQNGSFSTQATESNNEKEIQEDSKSRDEQASFGYSWKLCNGTTGTDYIPCLDNEEAILNLWSTKLYDHRERHYPEEGSTCPIPLPEGYKRPISWPDSRTKIWNHNVPHTKLAVVKGHQHWVKVTGEYLTFPGGGTQFKHGALHYIDFVQETLPDIAWGKRSRVVWDVGCGVASFGGYLFDGDVITMSFAPKDEHEAQVQFALERGIPALFAARALLVDKFHFSGSEAYGKGAIVVQNGDTKFLGVVQMPEAIADEKLIEVLSELGIITSCKIMRAPSSILVEKISSAEWRELIAVRDCNAGFAYERDGVPIGP
ncbi:probable methyltransferase PMT24 [Aristolochia californica]|uniref:probable methyltransferase PMT24 n=1 Tax=Aristolochia californica TaxID=171875 RepID=UPI0035D8A8B6